MGLFFTKTSPFQEPILKPFTRPMKPVMTLWSVRAVPYQVYVLFLKQLIYLMATITWLSIMAVPHYLQKNGRSSVRKNWPLTICIASTSWLKTIRFSWPCLIWIITWSSRRKRVNWSQKMLTWSTINLKQFMRSISAVMFPFFKLCMWGIVLLLMPSKLSTRLD